MNTPLRRMAKAAFSLGDLFLGAYPGPRLLIYHQVNRSPGREMEVEVEAFRAHLDWLVGNGRVVSLEQALARRHLPEAAADYVVTFDDGYRDLHRYAFPLLRDHELPFTLYLTTAPIETRSPLTPGGGADPLTWGEIEEMVETGLVTLGAHTHTHPDLRGLGSAEIEEELDTSNQLIERRLGHRPRHFAYPKGYWAAPAEPLVRARYQSAVLGAGPPLTGETDPFRLSRIPIQRSDGRVFFRRKLRTGMRLEEAVRRGLRGYRGPPEGVAALKRGGR